jgi:hypothetical protein
MFGCDGSNPQLSGCRRSFADQRSPPKNAGFETKPKLEAQQQSLNIQELRVSRDLMFLMYRTVPFNYLKQSLLPARI